MALMSSCTDQKTAPSTADNDTTSVAQDTASIDSMDLTSIAGTYEGTLPAADCPGIKTVLTIHADSTYQLTQDYLERKFSAFFTIFDRAFNLKHAAKI